MKKILYALVIPFFLTSSLYAQPEVVIVGSDGDGGDEFAFVLLKNFSAGELLYFTEDEYSETNDNFLSGEGHIQYTVPAGGLLEGEVVIITESSDNTYTVTGGGGTATHVAGSGDWGLSFQDEVYAYSASNASAPWDNVTTVHCFYWTAVIDPLLDQVILNDYPGAFYLEPNNHVGNPGNENIDFMTGAARVNTTPADLQNINNWNRTVGNITLSTEDFTNNLLPIELLSFEARLRKNEAILEWVTLSEVNNDRFEIEHSTDGRQFTKIGTVAGSGTTNLKKSYEMIDRFPSLGINYYRLKQIDYDGTFSYSNIAAVRLKDGEKSDFSIYPNPFYQNITLQFSSSEDNYSEGQQRTIEVYDQYGRLAFSRETLTADTNVDLDLSLLSSGVYFIHSLNGNSVQTGIQRIIKL